MASGQQEGTCRICGQVMRLTFEHTPPSAAFNDMRAEIFSVKDWLDRGDDGKPRRRGRIQQRGMGAHTLCSTCNNRTGKWYVPELVKWTHAGVAILRELPLAEQADRDPNAKMAVVHFRRVHPARFIKRVVTMLLAVNSPEFTSSHPELTHFVLERDRTGLPDRYRFYLSMVRGSTARAAGLQGRLHVETGALARLTEVAYAPFAYLMTVDTPFDVLPIGKIDNFANCRYGDICDVELSMVVGFAHTMYASDYRSKAAMATATGA